jgi:hypothetical protein
LIVPFIASLWYSSIARRIVSRLRRSSTSRNRLPASRTEGTAIATRIMITAAVYRSSM